MQDRAPERLAIVTAALVLAAAAALAAGAQRRRESASREFQRVVHGLGSGTATSLVPCVAAFDARSGCGCDRGLEPVPGGFAFCPHHAGVSLSR